MILDEKKYLVTYDSGEQAVIMGRFLKRMFGGEVSIKSWKEVDDEINEGLKPANFSDEHWNSIKTGVVKYDSFAEQHTIFYEDSKFGELMMGMGVRKEQAQLYNAAPKMFEAMKEFVQRVDDGEVRSKHTYEKFKAIIAEVEKEEVPDER